MDGDINYSTFARPQLEEALNRIDRVRFPKNYENLIRELQARPEEEKRARHAPDLRRVIRLLGWYQLLATAVLLYVTITSSRIDITGLRSLLKLPSSTLLMLLGSLLVFVALAATTAIAGYLTVRGHSFGPKLSIASFGAQVLSITIPGFSYQYLPLAALHVYWSSASFGLRALMGPDTKFSFGGDDPVRVAVDLLAAAAVFCLIRFVRSRAAS